MTDRTDEEERLDELRDGSPSGRDAGEDTASGGAPEPPEKEDPDGTPVENPSG